MPFGLHPKVAWPLLINAFLTILATVIAAWQKGDQAALLSAVVGGAVTVVGLVTGYAVSSPAVPAVTASPSVIGTVVPNP